MATKRKDRRGRPRKPKALISSNTIAFRVTDMERYEMEQQAAPLILSAWIRQRCGLPAGNRHYTKVTA